MTNLTTVTLLDGAPTAGTGTVSTLDNLLTLGLAADASLQTIISSINANGQAASVNSSPVVIASDQSTLPISIPNGGFTDRSSTITAGTASQTLAALNAARLRIIIQNPSTAAGQGISPVESLYINFTSDAGIDNGTSLELLPGSTFDSDTGPVSPELITVNATTTGHVYIAKEM